MGFLFYLSCISCGKCTVGILVLVQSAAETHRSLAKTSLESPAKGVFESKQSRFWHPVVSK